MTHDLKWSRDQEKRSSVGIKKKSEEIVLDFDLEDKLGDGELDLVQKLNNVDCIIYFIEIYSTFSNARLGLSTNIKLLLAYQANIGINLH